MNTQHSILTLSLMVIFSHSAMANEQIAFDKAKNHRLGSLNVKNTVIASEQSERGNLLTTENHTLNQGIATPCIRKARNDEWSLWWARIPTLQGLSF